MLWKYLDDLEGIGNVRQDNLWQAGFRTPDDIRNASILELEKVEGIGWYRARMLKLYFEEIDD